MRSSGARLFVFGLMVALLACCALLSAWRLRLHARRRAEAERRASAALDALNEVVRRGRGDGRGVGGTGRDLAAQPNATPIPRPPR